jgi:hypothetical protein
MQIKHLLIVERRKEGYSLSNAKLRQRYRGNQTSEAASSELDGHIRANAGKDNCLDSEGYREAPTPEYQCSVEED